MSNNSFNVQCFASIISIFNHKCGKFTTHYTNLCSELRNAQWQRLVSQTPDKNHYYCIPSNFYLSSIY